jgi:hypothetical protein
MNTSAASAQSNFNALQEEFKNYVEELKRKWLAQNKIYSVNVLEAMTKIELDEVKRRIRQWGVYIQPLAEAWWKERGYGVTWPDDDSKPVRYHKLETA